MALLLNVMRRTALELLRAHDAAKGRGIDTYNGRPRSHPMADGVFLEAAGLLQGAGLLGTSEARRIARRSLTRLRSQATAGAWGLGFAWNHLPATTVYSITTAMVLRGLVEARELLIPEEVNPLIEDALRNLRAWREAGIPWGEVKLIPYSPHHKIIAWNVVVQSAYAEQLADPTSDAFPDYRLTLAAREGALWPYGPEQPRRDLLHECYIAEPLLRAGLITPAEAITTIAPFLYGGDRFDRLDPIVDDKALLLAIRKGELLPLVPPLRRIEGAPQPWSLAAALALVAETTRREPDYQSLLRDLAARVIEDPDPVSQQPRHAAHRCLALAQALRAMRDARRNHALME